MELFGEIFSGLTFDRGRGRPCTISTLLKFTVRRMDNSLGVWLALFLAAVVTVAWLTRKEVTTLGPFE